MMRRRLTTEDRLEDEHMEKGKEEMGIGERRKRKAKKYQVEDTAGDEEDIERESLEDDDVGRVFSQPLSFPECKYPHLPCLFLSCVKTLF